MVAMTRMKERTHGDCVVGDWGAETSRETGRVWSGSGEQPELPSSTADRSSHGQTRLLSLAADSLGG